MNPDEYPKIQQQEKERFEAKVGEAATLWIQKEKELFEDIDNAFKEEDSIVKYCALGKCEDTQEIEESPYVADLENLRKEFISMEKELRTEIMKKKSARSRPALIKPILQKKKEIISKFDEAKKERDRQYKLVKDKLDDGKRLVEAAKKAGPWARRVEEDAALAVFNKRREIFQQAITSGTDETSVKLYVDSEMKSKHNKLLEQNKAAIETAKSLSGNYTEADALFSVGLNLLGSNFEDLKLELEAEKEKIRHEISKKSSGNGSESSDDDDESPEPSEPPGSPPPELESLVVIDQDPELKDLQAEFSAANEQRKPLDKIKGMKKLLQKLNRPKFRDSSPHEINELRISTIKAIAETYKYIAGIKENFGDSSSQKKSYERIRYYSEAIKCWEDMLAIGIRYLEDGEAVFVDEAEQKIPELKDKIDKLRSRPAKAKEKAEKMKRDKNYDGAAEIYRELSGPLSYLMRKDAEDRAKDLEKRQRYSIEAREFREMQEKKAITKQAEVEAKQQKKQAEAAAIQRQREIQDRYLERWNRDRKARKEKDKEEKAAAKKKKAEAKRAAKKEKAAAKRAPKKNASTRPTEKNSSSKRPITGVSAVENKASDPTEKNSSSKRLTTKVSADSVVTLDLDAAFGIE